MNIQQKAKTYAIQCHAETNHLYDDQPYEIHLRMVVAAAEKFIHLIPEADRDTVLAGCWVHDCIEDCRQTYNDIKAATNETVAEIAYALTNEKGKNRKERANDLYYAGIKNTPFAVFAKLCDRIANVQYSVNNKNQEKLQLYRNENADFEKKIYDLKYEEMFEFLRNQFNAPKV
jgi:(p)ppGpp synthase/HD superfamily hydrolase